METFASAFPACDVPLFFESAGIQVKFDLVPRRCWHAPFEDLGHARVQVVEEHVVRVVRVLFPSAAHRASATTRHRHPVRRTQAVEVQTNSLH